MATTKKSPAKKAAPKKPVAKKSPVKKPAVKSTKSKAVAAKQAEVRSFRISPEPRKFSDFRITRQTVYWIILVSFIIFAQLWILKLQIEVATLVDAQQVQLEELMEL